MNGQALDLRRSARIVWQLKALVGGIIALGFMGGAVYTVLSPAVYQSSALVAISPSVWIASQASVVTSPSVLATARAGVDRDIPLATLQQHIQVETAAYGLMAIVAEAGNSRQAIDTANVVARSYVAYVGSGSSLTTGSVPAQLFQAATSAEGTALPWRLFYAAGTGALVGTLMGVIVALAVGRANRPLRTRDEIADSIGVPIIASIRVSRPARPAGWAKLLNGYQPEADDALRLRRVLRELRNSGSADADLAPGEGSSVAVLSLSSDRKALALGPQLAAFAASQDVPATLVLDSRQDAKATAALRAACSEATRRGPGHLDITVTDSDDSAALAPRVVSGLAVVVAVVDSRAPRVASTMRATTTVLGVASGAATAQQLARVAASAAGDGRDIAGILVADPDLADPTTGRLPQLARLGQHRMPKRMTTAVTETRQ